MKSFTIALALITTGAYASTSGGLATEDTDLRSLVEALATKVDEQSNKIDQQSNEIAYLKNKMIQGKKKKLRGLREDEVDQNLEQVFYFDKIKAIDDALTTIQGCLEFNTADGGTCTVGENAASVTVFTDNIHPNGDGPINVSGSGLTATTLKATGILESGVGLVGASSTPALVLTGDLQVNGAIHSSGEITSESFITAKSGAMDSVELTAEAATRLAADDQEVIDRNMAIADAISDEVDDRNMAIADAISDEVDDRNMAIADAISDEVDDRNMAIADAISDEVDDRNMAIADAISDEVDDRNMAIADAISDEELSRQQSDAALQANIDTVTNYLQHAPDTQLV